MQARYTKTFKIEAVKKALSRIPGSNLTEVANTLGLPKSTLYGWVEAMKKREKTAPLSGEGATEKKPCQWSSQEKFDAIIETASFSEEAVAEYCRKKGIFPHHLQSWKKEFREGSSKKHDAEARVENKILKEEIKTLSRELHRKEKALAEAAALLVLKKKADDYWDAKEGN